MTAVNSALVRSATDEKVRLLDLIKEAVGTRNLHNIDEAFSSEPFNVMVNGVGEGKPFLLPFLRNETGYEVIKRIERRRFVRFGDLNDLARYMISDLPEIKKFGGVLALDEKFWQRNRETGVVYAPYAYACTDRRERKSFSFFRLSAKFSPRQAVLVFGQVGENFSTQGGV